MRYIMMIRATQASEAGIPPDPNLVAAIGQMAEELKQAGAMLMIQGLQPSATGTRLKYAGGKRIVMDGPFTESKELIGGFALIEAPTHADALALANRCIDIHVQAGAEVEMELRPLSAPGECGGQTPVIAATDTRRAASPPSV